MTASHQILRVAFKPSEAETLSDGANSVRSTLFVGAEVSNARLLWKTGFKGVSFMGEFAATIKAADGVDTNSVLPTYLGATFVDVKTADKGVAVKTFLARANFACAVINTFRIISTFAILYYIHG